MSGPIEIRKECSHLGNLERDLVLQNIEQLKAKAKSQKTDPRSLYTEMHHLTGQAVLAQSQTYEPFRQKVNRERNDAPWHSKSSPDLSKIEIPNELKTTLRGMTFYYDDSGPDDSERIIMFTTDQNIEVFNYF